ncbi:hypothetical protein HZA86_04320 [Candidatus Uhrbacteria bacterium]|nr:hypothetical protein [Candidatus Uhrbacteria bacterium]
MKPALLSPRWRQILHKPVHLPAAFIIPSAIALAASVIVVFAFQLQLIPPRSNAEVSEPIIQCSSETKDNPCENARAGMWGDWVSTEIENAWVQYQYNEPMRITGIKLVDQGAAANEITGATLDFDGNPGKRKTLNDLGIGSLSHQQRPIIPLDPPITAKTVQLTITTTNRTHPTAAAGLAEFRIYARVAPPIIEPTAPPQPLLEPIAPSSTTDTGKGVINAEFEIKSRSPLTITLKTIAYDANGELPEPTKKAVFTHQAQVLGADGSVFWGTDFILPSRTYFGIDPKNKDKLVSKTIETGLPFVVPLKNSFIKKRLRIINIKTQQEVASFDFK